MNDNKNIKLHKSIELYGAILLLSIGLAFSIARGFSWVIVIICSLVTVSFLYKAFGLDELSIKLSDLIIFLALFSGPPRPRSRDPLASFRGELDLVIIIYIFVWLLGAIWIVLHFISQMKTRKGHVHLDAVQWLAITFNISILLSALVSPVVLLSAFRGLQITILLFFCYFYVNKYGISGTVRSLNYSYFLIGLAIVLSALFAPDLVYVDGRLRGDYIASTGYVGVIGLILTLTSSPTRYRFFNFLLSVMYMWMLLASRTRAAYVAFILFTLMMILKAPQVFHRKTFRYLFYLAIPFIFVYGDQITGWLIREPESISTLSDRTRIWNALLLQTMDFSPLLGMGYYSERLVTLDVNPGIGTAHGTPAMIIYGAGFLGFGLFVLLWLVTLYRSIKLWIASPNDTIVFLLIMIILTTSIIGIVSEDMITASTTGFTFYLFLSLLPNISLYKNYLIQD